MVELLDIPIPDRHLSIYDPASGTVGMLSVAKEHLLERAETPEERARVEQFVTVHGQELSATNYAVCQADLLIKNDRQATVHLGNSLIPDDPYSREPGDQWPETKWRFHRMLSNPPFGVTWGGKDGRPERSRAAEGAGRGADGRVHRHTQGQRRQEVQGEALAGAGETLAVEWTHRHYVQDDEYIPHGEDIAAFLTREIAKPIIRWEETKKDGKPILGYEILPNKYFYRYQPPRPAQDLLAEFWRLEKEAEKMLEGLAR